MRRGMGRHGPNQIGFLKQLLEIVIDTSTEVFTPHDGEKATHRFSFWYTRSCGRFSMQPQFESGSTDDEQDFFR